MKWLFYPIAFFLGVVFIGIALAGVARSHPCASIFGAAALVPLTLFVPKKVSVLGAIAVVFVAAWLFLGPHFLTDAGARCFSQTWTEWRQSIRELACRLPLMRVLCPAQVVIDQAAREANHVQLECLIDAAKKVDSQTCDLVQGCGTPDFNGGSQWLTCASVAASTRLSPDAIRKCDNPNMFEPIVRFGKDVAAAGRRLVCGSIYGILSWLPQKWQPTVLVERMRRCSIEPSLSSCPAP